MKSFWIVSGLLLSAPLSGWVWPFVPNQWVGIRSLVACWYICITSLEVILYEIFTTGGLYGLFMVTMIYLLLQDPLSGALGQIRGAKTPSHPK